MKIIITVLLLVSNITYASSNADFVITVRAESPGSGADAEFPIYTNDSLYYNYNIDCDNDGVDEAGFQTGDYTCIYRDPGTYTIRIKDKTGVGTGFPAYQVISGVNSVAQKLLAVEQWGTGIWMDMANAFNGATNTVINATDVPNFSNVISMAYMFSDATLANPGTSNWDTSSVINMAFMFRGATSANPDTSNWDTSAVGTILAMFQNATSANPDTSNWDISSVTNMRLMFLGVTLPTPSYDQMLIGFATQNLQNDVDFHGGNSRYCSAAAQAARASIIANYNWSITDAGVCSADDFVITVKTDNLGSGTDTEFIIYRNVTVVGQYNYNVDCNNDGIVEASAITGNFTCSYLVAGTYTVRIIDNSGTGNGFPAFWTNSASFPIGEKILAVEQWGTGQWESMLSAFSGATNMVINATDIPNLSNVANMMNMFRDAVLASPDTSNWDTSSVTNMAAMFLGASSANPDTSNWTTSSVTNMRAMFFNATSANPDTSNWDISSVTDTSGMFRSATSSNPNTSNWDTSAVTNMISMFWDATSANPNTSSWDTSNVTNMSFMFRDAISANPDTSSWDTSSATNMFAMFLGATSASPIISTWDVSSVTNMSLMFDGISLPTSEYEAALINFSTQNLQSNVVFGAGNSQYCSAAAQAAKASIIANYNWNITDGGVCPAEIFVDGFESTVVVFKTAEAQFVFDFADIGLLPEDETPKLIATGIDSENQINIKIYLRQFDGVLEIMQSQLFEDLDGQAVWSDGLWYEVIEQGLSEVELW
ncbi:MAG: DUF285 domain-containing protein [Proteobacteria bacterium]|nr:DUF285 domain-containing protein [Pseudomonadota bacterium]